jgi:hypothetical protein
MQRKLIWAFLLCGLCACGDSQEEAVKLPPLDVDVTLGMTCSSSAGDQAASDEVQVDDVFSCVYYRGSQNLALSLYKSGTRSKQLRVKIGGFTGPGTYLTDKQGYDSIVDLDGSRNVCRGTSGSDSCSSSQDGDCTINVTETNLHQADVSPGTTGFVVLSVTCRSPLYYCNETTGSSYAVALEPSSFTISIPDCYITN